jgi:thiamine-monophosphate kinase
MTRSLRDRGEVALLDEIRRLIPSSAGVLVGPGDDAAVLKSLKRPLLLTTDALIEGVHFRRSWLSARELGRRAFHVAASDVAAMGGRVAAVLLAVAAPADLPVVELRGIVRGVRDAARAVGAALTGGNLSQARQLSLTVAVLGEAPARPVLRSGAAAGDRVFVTGTLGGAARGLRLLMGARSMPGRETAIRCWRRPAARLQAGHALAAAGIATAMIDLSDGLVIDAGRLGRASGCGVVLRADRLPLATSLRALEPGAGRALAASGGEDYELLFTVARRAVARLARVPLGCRVTEIGETVPGRGVRLVEADGSRLATAVVGHEHFRARAAARS